FALEETAGNTAGSVCLFLVVDRQREEILAWCCGLSADGRDQDDGIVHVDQDGGVRLTGNGTCFKGDVVISKLETLLDCLHFYSLFLTLFSNPHRMRPSASGVVRTQKRRNRNLAVRFLRAQNFSPARRRLSGAAPAFRSTAGSGRDSCS